MQVVRRWRPRALSTASSSPPRAPHCHVLAYSTASGVHRSSAAAVSPSAGPPEDSFGPHWEGLPPAALAKALLVGSCRAQLTTVRSDVPPGSEVQVRSTLVRVVAPEGLPPLALLSQAHDGPAIADLAASPASSSLCFGHTDPPALQRLLRAAGRRPARAVFVGPLERLPTAALQAQLQAAARRWRGTALESALPAREDARVGGWGGSVASNGPKAPFALDGLAGFVMARPLRCRVADARGELSSPSLRDVDAALVDPLARHQLDLLHDLSARPEARAQLTLLCAAYMGVELRDALLLAVDRFGFTVLGLAEEEEAGVENPGAGGGRDGIAGRAAVPASAAPPPFRASAAAPAPPAIAHAGSPHAPPDAPLPTDARPAWRQFRFAFEREVGSLRAFRDVLADMHRESERWLRQARQKGGRDE